jgi:hypothetical protein
MTLVAMDRGKACTTSSGHSSTATRPSTVSSAPPQPTPLAAALAAAVSSSTASPAGPASLAALCRAAPTYVSMENMPPSHWQRTAPLQMVPLPVLPVLPVTPPHGRKTQEQQPGVTGAGGSVSMAAVGSATLGGRLTSQRRVSVTSTAGAALAASR